MNVIDPITRDQSSRHRRRRSAPARHRSARPVLGALAALLVVLPAAAYGAGVGRWRGVYTGGPAIGSAGSMGTL